jgi:hypothetical protein
MDDIIQVCKDLEESNRQDEISIRKLQQAAADLREAADNMRSMWS